MISFFFCVKRILQLIKLPPQEIFYFSTLNQYHQLSRWFGFRPIRARFRLRFATRNFSYLLSPLGLLFLAFVYRLTRKRVDILFQRHLVIFQIFLQLISNILFYLFFIFSHCINIVSPAPEVSVPILIF